MGSNPTAAKFHFCIMRTLVVYSSIKAPSYAIKRHWRLCAILRQNMLASRFESILKYPPRFLFLFRGFSSRRIPQPFFTVSQPKSSSGIPTIFSGTLPLASDFHSHYTRFVSNLNFLGHLYIIIMELLLLLSLHRKFGRLSHCI